MLLGEGMADPSTMDKFTKCSRHLSKPAYQPQGRGSRSGVLGVRSSKEVLECRSCLWKKNSAPAAASSTTGVLQ